MPIILTVTAWFYRIRLVLLIGICGGIFLLTSRVYSEDMAALPKNVLYVMLNYKNYFGKSLHIAGIMAEQDENEFVLEAFPHEAEALKVIDNRENWTAADLFLNIRVDNQLLLREIQKMKAGQAVVIHVQVKESAVYDRIVPVFVLTRLQILKTEK